MQHSKLMNVIMTTFQTYHQYIHYYEDMAYSTCVMNK